MKANQGKVLFTDDIVAITGGVKIDKVQNTFLGYGGGLIKNTYDCSDIDAKTSIIISPIILQLSKINTWDLFDMVRKSKSPWHITYSSKYSFGRIIETNLMVLDDTLEVIEEK